GLLAAILVCPRRLPLSVCIDNATVVNNFSTMVLRRGALTARQRTRAPYATWWATVHQAYINHGGKISVKWIRGHNGQRGNEAADKAAKGAHEFITAPWTLKMTKELDLRCTA